MTMNYDYTDVIFVIEKSITLKRYLNELIESYISPAISYFAGGISEENDVFFTQSSLVQYGLVFFGSELTLLGGDTQIETYGPTTSQVSILSAIKDGNYCYQNTNRQAYIFEGLQTAIEVFKDLSGSSTPSDSVRRCLILVTQSIPLHNLWATTTQENIFQDLKKLGVKTSIISAHKLVELYKLYENAGGEQQSVNLKNYSSKPQHLVLLSGFQLQERAVSPSLINQQVGNINVPTPGSQMGMNNPTTGPSPNPAQHNRPTPSPGQSHTGSPAPPQQQQTNQIMMPRTPAGMNPTPSSPAMVNPQVSGPLRGAQVIQNNQIMNTQTPNVAMNTRQRWPMASGSGMMIANAQGGPQQGQMPQMNQQNPQMGTGNMQQVNCGMAGPVGPINRAMNPNRTSSPPIIWQGTLEWSEKKQVTAGGNTIQRIPCKVSSQPINGKVNIKTDGWPSTLQMFLVQKDLLKSVGNPFFQNAYKVMFLLDSCPALDNLNASLTLEYAGCVHLGSNCEVKMIIMLFTPDKNAHIGFIPYDQNGFMLKIKQVFNTQSRNNMQSQNMNKNVGNMIQGSQVGTSGNAGPQPGVPQQNMQMISNVQGMNVSQSNMIIQQNQMNPSMSQGGMATGNPMVGSQVGTGGPVNQMSTGGQGQTMGLGGQPSQMNMGSHVSQGSPMTNQMGNNQSVMTNKMVRTTMNVTGQQPTDQMQMRQPMHPNNIRQQMQMQVNIGGQPRMVQSQMRQLLQQQRLQQQQHQQQQMMMMQQQNMRPQMNQSQQVMGQQVINQQGMGQQGLGQPGMSQQQGMGQQNMGQQGMGQGMNQTMQDGTTDYMDLL